jgi:hypothetical protein
MARIPAAGDAVEWQSYTFEIVDMDGPRIDKILVHLPPPSDQTEALLAQDALLPPPNVGATLAEPDRASDS